LQVVQIQCFVAVADALSFRAGARALSYSPSHVSQQIRLLESDLGVVLFDRSTHHVRLTPIGMRLLPEARELLRAHSRVFATADQLASNGTGRLRVCYSSGSGSAAATAVRAFVNEYPNVEVVMTQTTNRRMTENILEHTADVGLALSTIDLAPGLSCLAVDDYPQNHLAVPVDHPLTLRSHLSVTDLVGQRLLLPSDENDTTHARRITDFLSSRGIVADHVMYPFTSEEEVIDIVSAGLGVVFVGESTQRRWGAWPEVSISRLHGEVPVLSQLMFWRDSDESGFTRAFTKIARRELVPHLTGSDNLGPR
jgi:DNA-binding transcriptional LysR family regulator